VRGEGKAFTRNGHLAGSEISRDLAGSEISRDSAGSEIS
jgi:hypothetical protein